MPSIPALVCPEPGKLFVAEVPAPVRASGEVLVKPRRVGICGTDYHIYDGTQPYLQYPRIMGHELAVEVVETPPGSEFAPGEICVVNPYLSCGECVACKMGKPNCCTKIAVLGVHRDGGMTGLLTLPPRNLVRADGLSADQCATVEFLAIGAHAVRRAAVTNADSVVVVGAGPIGIGVALFARLSGGNVYVYDRDEDRAAAAAEICGCKVLAGDDAAQAAMAATGGDNFNVVFDATGSARAMAAGFDLVSHGGRYVLVSIVKDAITFSDPDFHRKEMTLLASRNATAIDFERVIGALRSGDVVAERLITHHATLEGAVTELPRWATQKTGLIKAVIELA